MSSNNLAGCANILQKILFLEDDLGQDVGENLSVQKKIYTLDTGFQETPEISTEISYTMIFDKQAKKVPV